MSAYEEEILQWLPDGETLRLPVWNDMNSYSSNLR